jgi:phosphoesterase RecJ-like protein
MRLLGLAVNTIQTAYDGRVAIVTAPLSMLDQAGASDDMAEGLVEYGRMLHGVEIAIMLWERRARAEETLEGSVLTRMSLRSAGSADVSRVAVALGGGGHRSSAGATFSLSLAKVRELVLLEAGRELGLATS